MGIMPGVEWRGTIRNRGPRTARTIGVTVHHMDGSFDSADSWFHAAGNTESSAHFGIHSDGRIAQWVDTDEAAYHACMAQWQGYIGIENESDPDRPNDGPTGAQVEAMAKIVTWLGIPAVPINAMGERGVGYHREFPGACDKAWGQTACPGDGFVGAIEHICDAVNATAPNSGEDDDMKPLYIRKKSDPAAIFVTDGIFKRHVGTDEWAFIRYVNPNATALPISDQWWDSLPTAS